MRWPTLYANAASLCRQALVPIRGRLPPSSCGLRPGTPALVPSAITPQRLALLPPCMTAPSSRAQLLLVRMYHVEKTIPWHRIRRKMQAQEIKQRKSKERNHSEILKRFRLTRFGWERRRARFRGKAKRRRSWLSKRNSRKIEYLHRSDFRKMRNTAPYFTLRVRDLPKDLNINARPERAILPAHLG
eukprot:gnl/TRDRNA2_/TRDRNA2_82285_c0_seq1.p1 gnl/TRDRNA2_/TRDRNA2_82285_c0~~gnl/TRDRNA2_/TRDRNA2_82285_c0_seq1.p1  ORF type:complete len:187 (+),score=20.78 gnl/TRDRNA2_/TRDRNA2_82285_c0_seq1:92-652(+)